MSRKRDNPVCDRDCFNCRFDDCICDEMTAADYAESRKLQDFVQPKTMKEKSIAAKKKAYYEENRESIAAKKKGNKLRAYRIARGYTQALFAKMFGLSQATISLYETGSVTFEEAVFPGINFRKEENV